MTIFNIKNIENNSPEKMKIINDYFDFEYLIKIFYDNTKDFDIYTKDEIIINTIKQIFNKFDLQFLFHNIYFLISVFNDDIFILNEYLNRYRDEYINLEYNSNDGILFLYRVIHYGNYRYYLKLYRDFINDNL
jgi:hypothetical protein